MLRAMAHRPATILYLSRGGSIGGSQRQLLNLVAGLDRSRYRPVVVCRSDGPFVRALRGREVETYPVILRPWRELRYLLVRYLDSRRLTRLARRWPPALVHANDPWLTQYMARVAGALGVPSILHVRAPMTCRQVRKHGCGLAGDLVAISRRIRNDLVGAGLEESRISVIPDSVDLDQFKPSRGSSNVLRRQFPAAQGALIGIVGRIGPLKRQLEFLQAARQVLSDRPNAATFLIIGGDAKPWYDKAIRSFVAGHDLEKRVAFTGRRDDMPDVLASLDLLVTLSGGSVMLEALACGTPVVSAGFTRPEDSTIVRDGRTGFVLGPGQESQLPGLLLRLLDQPGILAELSANARPHVESQFGHIKLAGATQRLYDRVLGLA